MQDFSKVRLMLDVVEGSGYPFYFGDWNSCLIGIADKEKFFIPQWVARIPVVGFWVNELTVPPPYTWQYFCWRLELQPEQFAALFQTRPGSTPDPYDKHKACGRARALIAQWEEEERALEASIFAPVNPAIFLPDIEASCHAD